MTLILFLPEIAAIIFLILCFIRYKKQKAKDDISLEQEIKEYTAEIAELRLSILESQIRIAKFLPMSKEKQAYLAEEAAKLKSEQRNKIIDELLETL